MDFLTLIKALSFCNKADPASYMTISFTSVSFKWTVIIVKAEFQTPTLADYNTKSTNKRGSKE